MVREIPLTKGYVAIVDDEDYERVVSAGKWIAQVDRRRMVAYGRRDFGAEAVMLHAFLTGWPLTDHINGDGLDNRRSNLRPATHAQNMRNRRKNWNNTSGFKGVSLTENGTWRARITIDNRRVSLGCFADRIEAARAYDRAAQDLHGEFARLNFPAA